MFVKGQSGNPGGKVRSLVLIERELSLEKLQDDSISLQVLDLAELDEQILECISGKNKPAELCSQSTSDNVHSVSDDQ